MEVIPVNVEREILRLCQLAERVTTEISQRARAAAEADAAYKVTHAKAFLKASGKTVGDRDAQADLQAADEYQARRIAEALLLAAQEAGRNYRAQLDALRSINANLRSQVA